MAGARWKFVLDGVELSTDNTYAGHILQEPDGLGMPQLETGDVSYPRMDGVTHFNDWYGPRIVTLPEVRVMATSAATAQGDIGAAEVTGRVQEIKQAWRRRQEDTVAYVTINGTGPYAMIGRPRLANVDYSESRSGLVSLMLRFDAVDHRLYLVDTDVDGNAVGMAVRNKTVGLTTFDGGRTYDKTYDYTYGAAGVAGTEVLVDGSDFVRPTITLRGPLTTPQLQNVTTGQTVGYNGTVPANKTVIMDLGARTVQLSGANRYHLATGDFVNFGMEAGFNELRLSGLPSDTGDAVVSWTASIT